MPTLQEPVGWARPTVLGWKAFSLSAGGDTGGTLLTSLVPNISPYNLASLREGLKPWRLYYFPCLRSTNDHAAELRRRGDLYAPAIVLTARQTSGRGRAGNTWFSADGCITMTFALSVEDHLAPHQLPLVAGLAVRNAAAELTGDADVLLKWPNDVLWRGKKLAGLLCERVHRVDLVGVGLNVNLSPAKAPKALRERLTSLAQIAGRRLDLGDVLLTLARHVRLTLARRTDQPFAALLQEYDRHHALVGRQITVINATDGGPVTGLCEGLDSRGRLLVRTAHQRHALMNGHVELL